MVRLCYWYIHKIKMQNHQFKVNNKHFQQFVHFLHDDYVVAVIKRYAVEALNQNINKKVTEICKNIIASEFKSIMGLINSSLTQNHTPVNPTTLIKKEEKLESKIKGKFYSLYKNQNSNLCVTPHQSTKEHISLTTCKNCGKGFTQTKQKQKNKQPICSTKCKKKDKNSKLEVPQLRKIKSVTKLEIHSNNKIKSKETSKLNENGSKLKKSVSNTDLHIFSQNQGIPPQKDNKESQLFYKPNFAKNKWQKTKELPQVNHQANEKSQMSYQPLSSHYFKSIKESDPRKDHPKRPQNIDKPKNMSALNKPRQRLGQDESINFQQLINHNETYCSLIEDFRGQQIPNKYLNYYVGTDNKTEDEMLEQNNYSLDLHDDKVKNPREKGRLFLKMKDIFGCISQKQKKQMIKFIDRNYRLNENEMINLWRKKYVQKV